MKIPGTIWVLLHCIEIERKQLVQYEGLTVDSLMIRFLSGNFRTGKKRKWYRSFLIFRKTSNATYNRLEEHRYIYQKNKQMYFNTPLLFLRTFMTRSLSIIKSSSPHCSFYIPSRLRRSYNIIPLRKV